MIEPIAKRMDRPQRIYADASVYGGCYDLEFRDSSRRFFDLVDARRFKLVISPLVQDELDLAPSRVKELYEKFRPLAEAVDISEDVLRLRQAYMDTQILGVRWRNDATHVALATVWNCRVIVSWNFKHIVNFQKIPLYNGVNLAMGYGPIAIHSPPEVIGDENENEGL